MSKGKLISFEGIEGVGKSTTINSIKKYLEGNNISVYCTREPGGTKYGESLKTLIPSIYCLPLLSNNCSLESAVSDFSNDPCKRLPTFVLFIV